MQTRSGNVYRYDVARPTLEKRVEPKVEKKVAPKVEKKVATKVEPNVNVPSNSSGAGFVSVRGSRVISVFIKPCGISDELAKFLNVPLGSQMLRTDVSKLINNYIRVNNLQDVANGRVINADAKLRKLLNITPADELTYFNLQKYMKHHFIRNELLQKYELLKKY